MNLRIRSASASASDRGAGGASQVAGFFIIQLMSAMIPAITSATTCPSMLASICIAYFC